MWRVGPATSAGAASIRRRASARSRDPERPLREQRGDRQEAGVSAFTPRPRRTRTCVVVDRFTAFAEDLRERRRGARGFEPALRSDARAEAEQRLDHRLTAVRAFHRGDLPDDATAVAQAREVDDDVDRGRDLIADMGRRQVDVRHHRHRLETPQQVPRRVRVRGGERSLVAGVHRLEHVEGLAAADLADDDPVRSHPQGVAHQLANRHLAPAFDVRRAAPPATITCGFASRSSAASSIVMSRSRSGMKPESTPRSVVLPLPAPPLTTMFARPRMHAARNRSSARAEAARPHEVVGPDGHGRELADRQHGTAERERRNDRMDPRTVRESRVHPW